MVPCLKVSTVWELSWGLMLTSPPPWRSVRKPFDFRYARRATSWVFPSWGVAIVLPLSWSTLVIGAFTTSPAPPDAVPATMRTAPLDLVKAVIDGLGPMKATSMAVERRASVSGGPALEGLP